jgi:hypothetical protein
VAEAKKITRIGPPVREDKREEKVERARSPESGAGRDADHGRIVEPPQPQHAARVHWSAQLEELAARIGQLGIRGVERIDS